MSKFYLLLWIRWSVRLTLCSVALASILASLITIYMYIMQGMPSISGEVSLALIDIFKFWFAPVWSIALLLALFRSLKYIFNICLNGYMFKLYTCDLRELILEIGYGNLVKVWRKWFMLLIWIVGSLMIISIAFTKFFTSHNGIFEWFNIYFLFSTIIVSGYFSFILMGSRCKRVRIERC